MTWDHIASLIGCVLIGFGLSRNLPRWWRRMRWHTHRLRVGPDHPDAFRSDPPPEFK